MLEFFFTYNKDYNIFFKKKQKEMTYTEPIYFSLSINHDDETNIDGTIPANIYESYNYPVISDASKYAVAIERLEINLNGIPFYNCENKSNRSANEILYYYDIENEIYYETKLNQNAYDLSHLLHMLNEIQYPAIGGDANFGLIWTIDHSGFISMEILGDERTFVNTTVIVPKFLNRVLGISAEAQVTAGQLGKNKVTSTFPRADIGDCLQHIILTSNLPTLADVQGQGRENVLTDLSTLFDFSSSFSFSNDGKLIAEGLSMSSRQKLVYVPQERRFLHLVGAGTFSFLRVNAMYADSTLAIDNILLPFGATFQIKLGFYKIG